MIGSFVSFELQHNRRLRYGCTGDHNMVETMNITIIRVLWPEIPLDASEHRVCFILSNLVCSASLSLGN